MSSPVPIKNPLLAILELLTKLGAIDRQDPDRFQKVLSEADDVLLALGAEKPEPQSNVRMMLWEAIVDDPGMRDLIVEDSAPGLVLPKIRGMIGMRDFLRQEGGLLSAKTFAERLGITVAELEVLRTTGDVIGFSTSLNPEYRFPAWQIHQGKMLPGLKSVLTALTEAIGQPTEKSALAQMQFFFTSMPHLGVDTIVLNALRAGNTKDPLEAASMIMQQGS